MLACSRKAAIRWPPAVDSSPLPVPTRSRLCALRERTIRPRRGSRRKAKAGSVRRYSSQTTLRRMGAAAAVRSRTDWPGRSARAAEAETAGAFRLDCERQRSAQPSPDGRLARSQDAPAPGRDRCLPGWRFLDCLRLRGKGAGTIKRQGAACMYAIGTRGAFGLGFAAARTRRRSVRGRAGAVRIRRPVRRLARIVPAHRLRVRGTERRRALFGTEAAIVEGFACVRFHRVERRRAFLRARLRRRSTCRRR